jgi:glycosyltransferase involved in cell wall biosynthesis
MVFVSLPSSSDHAVKPLVSVIIPCYNTADFVAETLDSVLAQTYQSFEVIVVNDGSPDTDALERVLDPYRGRIAYIRKENGGVSSARNCGIRISNGELIAVIDSDDMWVPEYLAFQVDQLNANPSADIVYPNAVFFGAGESGRWLAMKPSSPMPEVTFSSLVTEACVVVTSVLARKTALQRAGLYDETLGRCEDFDLWLRCVKSGSRIIYHHNVLLRYRRRPGSLSSDPAIMAANAAKVLRKALTKIQLSDDERNLIERKLAKLEGDRLFYEAKQAFFAGDYSVAVRKFQDANRYLNSRRIARLVLLLRTAPRLARLAHFCLYRNRTSR